MRRRAKRRTYPQFAAPGPGRLALIALAWLPFFLAPLLGVGWLVAGPLAFWAAALATTELCAGSRRHGLRVTDDGFVELVRGQRQSLVRWSEVTEVIWLDGEAVIHHALGETRLAPPLFGWATIAARAESALTGAQARPAEAETLPVSEQDHANRPWLRLAIPALGCTGALLLSLALLGWLAQDWKFMGPAGILVKLWVGACLAGALALGSGLGLLDTQRGLVRAARVTGSGFELRDRTGWHRCGWGDLMGVTRQGLCQVVATTHGDFWLPPWLSDRQGLLRALEAALAARRTGIVLPRLTGDVPASALSPAALRVDAERGLSAPGEG